MTVGSQIIVNQLLYVIVCVYIYIYTLNVPICSNSLRITHYNEIILRYCCCTTLNGVSNYMVHADERPPQAIRCRAK
jgi:hypothetical protein